MKNKEQQEEVKRLKYELRLMTELINSLKSQSEYCDFLKKLNTKDY